MKKDIGVGIIGLKAGSDLLAINDEHDSRMRVVAVCDSHAAFARRVAERSQIPFVTTDPFDLLSQPGVDLVVVLGHEAERYTYSMSALGAGKHVLCGSPMASRLDDALELSRESSRASSKLFVTNPSRWHPDVEAVRSLQANGDLGDVRVVESQVVCDVSASGESGDTTRAENTLCEPLDLLRWVGGDITEVHGVGCCGDMLVNVRFEGGQIGRVMSLNGNVTPAQSSVSLGVYGSRGSYVNGQLILNRIAGRPAMTFAATSSAPVELPLVRCALHFEAHICDGVPLLTDSLDGAKAVAVCHALRNSLASGSPELVPTVDLHDAAIVKKTARGGASVEG